MVHQVQQELSGPGSNGSEGVLCNPQSSPSDSLRSYQDARWVRGLSYPSLEMQSVYYTAPVD